ncbi:MAG TPA: serine hydrolase domain-containing protein [Puia sp.]|nr:serine hydrolase domain-containing protein [Puia sp.]
MKRFLLIILLSVITKVALPQAQYISFRIDSAVRAAIEARHIPGLQIAVVKYSLVLKKGNYGFANLEDRVPVTDSTRFAIASMSKAFTCAGILLLMEDGKLSLDDSVGKYFDSLPPSWSGITLRRLMNHTSGLRDDWDNRDDIFFYKNDNDSSFLAAIKTQPLKFQPGQGFSYSCGPFLLGLIISKVSGESYPDFMKHRIFDKLGMVNSCINDADSIISNRAAGYIIRDQKIVHGRQISSAAQARGDVGVLTTLTDMLKWYTALQDTSLLKKSSIDEMFSPGLLNDSNKIAYDFGWFLGPYRDHPLITHNGAFRTGYSSIMDIYPEDHVGIIILCNLQRAGMEQLARNIVGLFNPDYGLASQMLRDSTDPDSVRTLLLKSDFTELGLNIDTTRKMINTLHVPFYFENDNELAMFRNVTEFNFIKAIKPSKPRPDIFGDIIQGIYLYEVKCRDQPTRYFAFFLNPTGKLVYLDLEE